MRALTYTSLGALAVLEALTIMWTVDRVDPQSEVGLVVLIVIGGVFAGLAALVVLLDARDS